MAGELKASGLTSGSTYYAVIRNASGQYLNGTTPESYNASNWTSYATASGTANTAGDWSGTFPALAAGVYAVQLRHRVGGSAAISDPVKGTGEMQWSGTAEIPLSSIKAKTDTITGDLTVTSPIDPDDGTITIIVGDGYESATRVLTFTVENYAGPSLVGATGVLRIAKRSDYLGNAATAPAALSKAAASVDVDGSTVTVTVVLAEGDTDDLIAPPNPGRNPTHKYQVLATAGTETFTLVLGDARVVRRIEPAA